MKTPNLALVQTCKMFPEQYDLIDAHGNRVAYYRLRHGYFSVECPDVGGTLVYEAHPDGQGDFMDYEREGYLAAALAAVKKHYGWEDEDKAPDNAPDIKVGHKTPDEIKKGLECCVIGPSAHQPKCGECPYKLTPMCSDTFLKDTLALIQQLQTENAEQADRIHQLEAERDAAVEDISMGSRCTVCRKFFKNGGDCSGGVYCLPIRFEWRGVQKEDSDAVSS